MNYPPIAISTGTEGRVVVRVLVGNDGSVLKIGNIKGPEVFFDAVKENVMDLQFTPAIQNNQTVECWVSVPFSFKLSNK
jgi:TonB family protein